MNTIEKIEKKKLELNKINERITIEQEKAKKISEEINALEATQIKGLMNEYNLSFPDIKELLQNLKTKSENFES